MKLVIDFRMHQSSGIGTYIRNIVPFLVDEFEVTLLGNIEEIESYTWANKVKKIEFNSPIYSIKEQIGFVLKIPKCDFFWAPHFNVPLLPILAKKRLVTIHDVFHLVFKQQFSFIQRQYAKLLLNKATKTSDIVFTVSEFSKAEILRFFSQRINNIDVVYNAIDSIVFYLNNDILLSQQIIEKYGLPQNFILYVGNVKPHKNLTNLLEALKQLPGVNLVIVGKKDGFITSDKKIMQTLALNESLNKRVFFTGFVSDKDIGSIYNLADIFIFPTLYEGFGLPPLEAQACGCPVIISNVASLPEIFEESALYCDPYNIEDITNIISRLLENKSLQIDLIEKGFNNIKRFNWTLSAQKIIKTIKESV
jgi:glycosyltransferase involved in cell wall biosynthesis